MAHITSTLNNNVNRKCGAVEDGTITGEQIGKEIARRPSLSSHRALFRITMPGTERGKIPALSIANKLIVLFPLYCKKKKKKLCSSRRCVA
jgi:hypothetical protein